jgi:hypothetical protein
VNRVLLPDCGRQHRRELQRSHDLAAETGADGARGHTLWRGLPPPTTCGSPACTTAGSPQPGPAHVRGHPLRPVRSDGQVPALPRKGLPARRQANEPGSAADSSRQPPRASGGGDLRAE